MLTPRKIEDDIIDKWNYDEAMALIDIAEDDLFELEQELEDISEENLINEEKE